MTTTLASSQELEWMDFEDLSFEDLGEALRYLDFVNRVFNGYSLFVDFLNSHLTATPSSEPLTILDVGTGSADFLIHLFWWGKKKARPIKLVGLEPSRNTFEYALENKPASVDVELRQQSLWDLDPSEKFDFVFSNLVLHHIAKENKARFLKQCAEHARRGVLIADLLRSWKNYWKVTAACTIWGNKVVRNDGPLSVRRALTLSEANQLITQTGLNLNVKLEDWCRMSIGGLFS